MSYGYLALNGDAQRVCYPNDRVPQALECCVLQRAASPEIGQPRWAAAQPASRGRI